MKLPILLDYLIQVNGKKLTREELMDFSINCNIYDFHWLINNFLSDFPEELKHIKEARLIREIIE